MIQVKIFYRKFLIDSNKNRNQRAIWNCFWIILSKSRSWDTSLCYTSFGVKDPVWFPKQHHFSLVLCYLPIVYSWIYNPTVPLFIIHHTFSVPTFYFSFTLYSLARYLSCSLNCANSIDLLLLPLLLLYFTIPSYQWDCFEMRPRISIRGSVCPSLRPLVLPSVTLIFQMRENASFRISRPPGIAQSEGMW